MTCTQVKAERPEISAEVMADGGCKRGIEAGHGRRVTPGGIALGGARTTVGLPTGGWAHAMTVGRHPYGDTKTGGAVNSRGRQRHPGGELVHQ